MILDVTDAAENQKRDPKIRRHENIKILLKMPDLQLQNTKSVTRMLNAKGTRVPPGMPKCLW